jgi:steroid 5-alpha reductase family enzyme
MQPLTVCLWICAATIVATWLLSVITREYSWVDRIWSISPIVYVWVFAAASGLSDARLVLMAVLVTLWGVRLTFNFARKGGYARGGEDYRWAALRRRMPSGLFQAFNLLFIAGYQNVLILGITLPAWTVYSAGGTALNGFDIMIAVLFLGLLLGETVADQQQWRFHQGKKAQAAAGRTPAPGVLQTGLFRYSRHPNFFFEQAQWWAFYLFAITATGAVLHWTLLAPVLLTLLFIGSTAFTESISRSRHPEYADYQATTSAVIPWFPRKPRVAAEAPAAS